MANLITNPGFETSGSWSGWTLTTSDAHTGSYSLAIGAQWTDTTQGHGSGIAVSPSTTYDLKVWVKTDAAGALIAVRDGTDAYSGTFLLAETDLGNTSSVWTEKTYTFTTGPSTTHIALRVINTTSGLAGFLDDFFIDVAGGGGGGGTAVSKVKSGGSFATVTEKVKIGGTFTTVVTKIKAGGSFVS